MKKTLSVWTLLSLVGCNVTLGQVTLDQLANQFSVTETNALLLIQRFPFTPQHSTGAIPIWRLLESVGLLGGGNNPNAITGLSGDVTATGPGVVVAVIANNAVTTA